MIPGREMAASGQQPSMLDSPFPQTLGGRSAKGTHSSTSYASYPKGMPFINSDYPRSPIRSGHAYPESNGKAIISALKNLQEKLHQLELDRLKAEENMKQLTKESSDCRLQLHEQRRSKESLLDDVSRRNKELSSQLSAAHSRCSVLEKQLDYMRKMVQNAESERNSVLEKQLMLESDQAHEKLNLREKIEKLEQEYVKLTTVQVMSENKIRDIERKLREEEYQRKLIEERASQLQSSLESNRILFSSLTSPTRDVKSPKHTSYNDKKASSASHGKQAQIHYRLSLGDVPFVAGKSTAPSHSVAANVQHVLSLMKQHNKVLCNDRVVSDQPMDRKQHSVRWKTDSSAYRELAELLLTLEDEFGQMSFDHQELLKQVHKAHSDRLKMDLELELASLVRRMEAKADQITKVRKHQARLAKLLKESRPHKEASAKDCKPLQGGKDRSPARVRHGRRSPGEKSRRNLQLLRDMQTIQSTLRKDDVHWS